VKIGITTEQTQSKLACLVYC